MNTRDLRRYCAEKRGAYHQAKWMYGEALRLGPGIDVTALRSELSEALLDYYAAHSALHGALKRTGEDETPLRAALH